MALSEFWQLPIRKWFLTLSFQAWKRLIQRAAGSFQERLLPVLPGQGGMAAIWNSLDWTGASSADSAVRPSAYWPRTFIKWLLLMRGATGLKREYIGLIVLMGDIPGQICTSLLFWMPPLQKSKPEVLRLIPLWLGQEERGYFVRLAFCRLLKMGALWNVFSVE